MPKIIDHGERRQELLAAVWRVIARDGLDRATIRSIAKETGWSSGVLAHYFVDKDDILISAIRLAHERIEDRWDEKLKGLSGLEALRELVIDNLPLDDERERETRFLMNYWSRSMRSLDGERPARDETWRRGPALVDRLATLVGEGQAAGEIVADDDPADVAERLLALIDGLSLHALLDPQRVTRERQLALATQELDRLAVAQSRGEGHA
ncbi:MAG TPA: TetR/AcrR family transcriptional regulator [Baekduia sp.]|nr:TetR/AcrR family transcriptional regulator [Baekduia sp.]